VTAPVDSTVAIQRLLDRESILDCIHRYARGVDRHDRELILSAYHSDGTHTRGSFTGSPEEFADWVLARHLARSSSHHHLVTNHRVDFEGPDLAHSETYYLTVSRNREDTGTTLTVGRYLDRFERRHGHWRIAVRVALRESVTYVASVPGADAELASVRWDRSDLSYQRPLTAPG
jgi:hypothetical protein